MTLLLVGVLSLLGSGVAAANPPGPDPLAGVPESLRPIAGAVIVFLGNVWNAFADVANFIMFGSS
ncbi:hypothetical protein FCG67_19035 [Rhodococcus oryzae]|uniref:Uncharacterized protein n=1 Tax=Rhodococcus oryzae TaxID=2571143 RepID=A0ABY2RJF0_9NOCA|nr:hypothetical protein [Rhodococcus oryzae]TJZ76102.1 hypothetical protein FCG67_19035 [Rhodococcus oryzae]